MKAVNGDGTYLEEGYNGNPAPNDHHYYTRTVNNEVPSAFLYVPGTEEEKVKRTLTALAAVLLCTACAPAAATGPSRLSTPSATASSAVPRRFRRR